jgi:hypothetical protein
MDIMLAFEQKDRSIEVKAVRTFYCNASKIRMGKKDGFWGRDSHLK